MRTLILNTYNLINDGYNNKLVYKFPSSVKFDNSYIALAQCNIYYSWYNISSDYQNNIIQYKWVNNIGTQTTYTITIPDGLYEIQTLNQLLQFEFIKNGHYLVNASGENVYYAEFIVNPSRYAVQINTYLVPTSLPLNFTNPAGLVFPNTTFNPSIILPSNVNKILGFVVNFTSDINLNNSYVAPVGSQYISKLGNGTISYISTQAPNVQPNSSIIVTLSNINNDLANPVGSCYSIIPSGVAIGEVINEKPSEFIFNKLVNGVYNQITVTLLGSDLNQIKINDPAMSFTFVIKEGL